MMKMTMRMLIGMILMMGSIMACPANWPVVENFQPTDLVGEWYDEVRRTLTLTLLVVVVFLLTFEAFIISAPFSSNIFII